MGGRRGQLKWMNLILFEITAYNLKYVTTIQPR